MTIDETVRLWWAAVNTSLSHEDAEHALALFILSCGQSELPGHTLELVGRAGTRMGLDGAADAAELKARMDAYLAGHAEVARALKELELGLRNQVVTGSAFDAVGQPLNPMSRIPVGHGPAPEGSVKASPLARFQVDPRKGK